MMNSSSVAGHPQGATPLVCSSSANACSGTMVDDSIPLSQAIGIKMPLYKYQPARPASSIGPAHPSPCVPEHRDAQPLAHWTQSCGPNNMTAGLIHAGKPISSSTSALIQQHQWAQEDEESSAADVQMVPALDAACGRLPNPFRRHHSFIRMETGSSLNGSAPSDIDNVSELSSSVDDMEELASLPHVPSDLMLCKPDQAEPARSTLDTVMTSLWEDCNARGLFRYDVGQCINKVVPGRWGWVAQLNEGRSSKKRPTELKVDAVLQPFDANKFHFGKAFLREALMEFEPLTAAGLPSGKVAGWAANPQGSQLVESSPMSADPTLVLINVSPIDYGHVLLAPGVLSQNPQQLSAPALSSALAFVREVANPTFRLGYNSLGAYATINHLHFQGYYLPHDLPCERARTQPLPGFHHPLVKVSTLVDYPVNGWEMRLAPGVDALAGEAALTGLLAQVTGALQARDQPFNVLMVEEGRRVFIWPQCYAERQAAGVVPVELLDTGVNPAVFEVAGHLILKRSEDFSAATDEWACRLLAGVSLTDERFADLTTACFPVAEGKKPAPKVTGAAAQGEVRRVAAQGMHCC